MSSEDKDDSGIKHGPYVNERCKSIFFITVATSDRAPERLAIFIEDSSIKPNAGFKYLPVGEFCSMLAAGGYKHHTELAAPWDDPPAAADFSLKGKSLKDEGYYGCIV